VRLPFENLRERLLRAGVAPRHVRRYLTELNEHMADLIQVQHRAGYTGDDAFMRARALLGSDDDLAHAMIIRRGVKSWSARVPWLIFTLLPPLSLLFLVLLWTTALVIIGGANGLMRVGYNIQWPEWYHLIVLFMTSTNNLLWPPATASLFVYIAWRQRLPLKWPLVATAILLMNLMRLGTQSGAPVIGVRWMHRFNSLELALMTPFNMSGWRVIAAHWPLVLLQWILTLLPTLWLLRTYMAKEKRSD
jgi:hypothetical protein